MQKFLRLELVSFTFTSFEINEICSSRVPQLSSIIWPRWRDIRRSSAYKSDDDEEQLNDVRESHTAVNEIFVIFLKFNIRFFNINFNDFNLNFEFLKQINELTDLYIPPKKV